jgi:hypothetical protein
MTRPHLTVASNFHHLSARTTLVLAAAAAFSLMACGGSSGGGTGGAPGIGGSPMTPTGGKTGTGGKGTGGAGTGGSGGFISPACGTNAPYSHTFGFGAILEGWTVAANSTPPSLAPVLDADGGTTSGTLVELDRNDGSPVNGSVKLTIPFNAPNQEMLFAQIMNGGLNMAGGTVTAKIKLDSGLNTNPVNNGKAFLILKTTSAYNYATGPEVPLDLSLGWVDLTFNVNAPVMMPLGYDPCDVKEIDVSVQTGGAGTYNTAVIHIDTIEIKRPGGTDAGADTSTDATAPTDATDDVPAPTDAVDAPPATDTAPDVQTDATSG